jgi:hypothetical protein
LNYFAKSCSPFPNVLARPFAPSVIFCPSFFAPSLVFPPISLAVPYFVVFTLIIIIPLLGYSEPEKTTGPSGVIPMAVLKEESAIVELLPFLLKGAD